jgi:UDP-N-acetylmuramoyl-L-alanyl-D-glutamate--2,6-diaminopimelate ligase
MSPHEVRCIHWELDRLLAGFGPALAGKPAPGIDGLCHDSRRVRKGDLFIALSGQRVHGLHHGRQAVERGAAAVAFDPAGEAEAAMRTVAEVPCYPVPELDRKLGLIADRFYAEPSRYLTTLAVTGTNGKTSCSHFLAQVLSGWAPTAVVGTLGWGAPGSLHATSHTTPDAIEVHETLFRLYSRGFRAAVLEASSHGLAQGRLNGVRFKGALYTNLSRDHLDYHGTLDAYREAKLRLLDWPGLEFVVFNADDALAGPILERKPRGLKSIGFSLAGRTDLKVPVLTVDSVRHGREGVAFVARFGDRVAEVQAPVYGDFNVENLAGSLAVLLAFGFELQEAALNLRRVRPVPGRMESFAAAGRTVVVDYAHTPDALESVLANLKRHCRGALWVVFGCGGDRDRGKRPEMGGIAERLADQVVLTDDNPRSEDGDAILDDILAGCRREDIVRIRDRREAIAWTLERAGTNDVVLIAGKGHETTQEIQGQKYPFSDREVVRAALAERGAPA